MIKKILYYICVVALFASAGCAAKPEGKEVLAKVSNKVITISDFKKRLAKLPSYYQEMVGRNKKKFLEETIVESMFYEEAVRKHLDKDAEVRDVINEARRKIMIAKLIKNEVDDRIVVSEDEMVQFYETNKDKFKTPELWRASHILVASEAEAKDALAELSKGVTFEELAASRSIDATASRGGDVGYFRKGQVVPDFEKACLTLNIGQTSGIIRTQFGYHIIRLTDKKDSVVEPFEKVRRMVEDELRKKKRSELFDKLVLTLKDRYGVRVDEETFAAMEKAEGESEASEKR